MTKFPSCNGERSWWLLSNDKCLRSATARTLWKKGESSAPSVFHAFLGAICERALNLYVCRGGALWLAYHRTQTQSATQWECLFNPSTDIDSYYSYDTRTRQKCFIRTGYSFQPSIRLNSIIDYGCARSSKCFGALHAHTHTLQPGEQRLSCGLCVQRLFNNSKDGILQQSPIELILTLSLGFREERMCEGKKKRGYNA